MPTSSSRPDPFCAVCTLFVGGILFLLGPDCRNDFCGLPSGHPVLSPEFTTGGCHRLPPLPMVGLGCGCRGCHCLGPGLDPFSVDDGSAAPHLHPALAGLYRRCQCAVLPPNRPFAADPPPVLFPEPVSGQRAVLVVFRVPQPLRAELALRRSKLRPWEYFWYATLPFATVLPAVLSTQEFIRSFAGFQRLFGHVRPLSGFGHPSCRGPCWQPPQGDSPPSGYGRVFFIPWCGWRRF